MKLSILNETISQELLHTADKEEQITDMSIQII